MATYTEIHNAITGQTFEDLRRKTVVATTIKAQTTLANASTPAARRSWATQVLSDPNREADKLLYYVLAANSGLSVSQMATVADNTLQTAINGAVDAIYPAE